MTDNIIPTTAPEVPPIQRNRGSKYDGLFEMASSLAQAWEDDKSVDPVVVFATSGDAARVAAYLRDIAPDGVRVESRSGNIYIDARPTTKDQS